MILREHRCHLFILNVVHANWVRFDGQLKLIDQPLDSFEHVQDGAQHLLQAPWVLHVFNVGFHWAINALFKLTEVALDLLTNGHKITNYHFNQLD